MTSSLATRLSRARAREAGAQTRGVVMLLGNNPYPQDERVRREALTLVEHGYTVSVICPRANGAAGRRDRPRGPRLSLRTAHPAEGNRSDTSSSTSTRRSWR